MNSMQYAVLGRSGLQVSRLSFGSWVTFKNQVGEDSAYELMRAAFRAGINFFDNAEAYAKGEAEKIMGAAICQGIENGDWVREDLVLSTKVYFGTRDGPNNKGLSRKHIVEGVKASLDRMGLDYVDIVFCHRPDPVTPIEETVRAMNFIIDKGWCFYWGTSEWSAQQITDACRCADALGLIRPVAEQPEYNLFQRHKVEVEFMPLYRDFGLGTTTWSPLASGVLSGKYSGKVVPEGSRLSLPDYQFLLKSKFGENSREIETTDELRPIAKELECTLSQLSIAWCLTNPNVSSVLMGATSVHQVQDNLGALEILPKLTPEILDRIELIIKTKPTPSKVDMQVANVRGVDRIHGLSYV